MANQFASISSAVSLLKNYYAGPLVSQFNDEIPIYKQMEKGKEKWNGQQVVRPIKVRRNQGIGAVSDGGTLPAIGQQTTQQALIAAKYNYLRFGVTGPMLKASQGDKGAFVSAMEYEMSEGMNDLKSDVNRQLFWDGTSDLATVSANAVASTVITVTGRESTEDGNKFLDVGVVIDIYSGTTLVASGVSITAISGTTTATLTLSAAVTCSANDIVVRSGSFGNEIQGILTQLDGLTTTVFGIDRSLYPAFQGNVVSASGGQLTLDLMQQAYNQGKQRGGAKYDAVFCDYASERFYNKLLVAGKRYTGTVVGDGTFSSKDGSYLEFAGCKVVPDKDMPQRFAFLDSKGWKKYVLAELEWADETGSLMIAQTSSDSFEARLRLFANIFCEKPSAQAILRSYISP
jgi:hypothetical protein